MSDQKLPNAGPSTLARVGAVLAVVISGACGGLIGYAVTDLQCEDCATWSAVGALVGAVGASVGVAIIVTLTIRATAEWRAIEARERAQAQHPPPQDLDQSPPR